MELVREENIRLVFKGVSHTAEILFDGISVACHYDAYTPFEVILPKAAAGNHMLEVRADNRFTPDSALHIPNDYYTYGGIIRPVVMQMLPEIYISAVRCTPF